MNHKKITTSKGEFVAMDMEHNSWFQNTPLPEGYTTEEFIKLSEATEEDASKVVDECKSHPKYWNYNLNYYREFNSLESLHSLLKSKGIDINNGNWYLFKKI